ncbi:MAG TPA: response regulator [Nitrospiraceae bacterium]|nr:response regulator [Nitrospiraceae bacterium]
MMALEQKDQPYILCVDDEPGIARAIRRILKAEPVNVLIAASGPEGLEILRKQSVSLVLTDYRMPEMNGIEFLEQAAPLCPDAFRMILTGYAEAHVLVEAVNRGQIYKILYKPFQEEDIKLTVRSGLEHHARNRENRVLLEELAQRNKQLAILNQKLKTGLEGTKADLTISSTALGMAQQLLNEIPAAVIGMEPSGQIVFSNRLANTWFAPQTPLRISSLVGTWTTDVLPEPIQEHLKDMIAAPPLKTKMMRLQVTPSLALQVTFQALSNGVGSEMPRTTIFLFAIDAETMAAVG